MTAEANLCDRLRRVGIDRDRTQLKLRRAAFLKAQESHRRVNVRAEILGRLESLALESELWRSRLVNPPVTKLTGLGWEEVRTLSDSRSEVSSEAWTGLIH